MPPLKATLAREINKADITEAETLVFEGRVLRQTGNATGTATGTTMISDTMTVTGLEGKALPALATGTLKYSGGTWTFDGNTYLASGVNVTTTGPLGGGGPLTSAGLTLTCATCLTGNQTITLTGAITGLGTTTIATAYATSTLYSLFSGSGPITFNASTGAIGSPLASPCAIKRSHASRIVREFSRPWISQSRTRLFAASQFVRSSDWRIFSPRNTP